MRLTKGVAAGALAAVIAGGGGTFALQHGGGSEPAPAARKSTSTTVLPTADEVIQSILGISRQVQATAAGGQPMSREQIEALVKQQQAQFQVKS